MHEGYEMHRNPFHNFTHGVNGKFLVLSFSHAYMLLDLQYLKKSERAKPT